MTGILERIESKLDAIIAAGGGPQTLATAPLQAQTLTGAAPLNAGAPLGGGVTYPPATQEMIVALVTPLVADPNVKAILQQEMHAMGIQALPEAQPHQYPELYYRFQQVQLRLQQQGQQPQAQVASII